MSDFQIEVRTIVERIMEFLFNSKEIICNDEESHVISLLLEQLYPILPKSTSLINSSYNKRNFVCGITCSDDLATVFGALDLKDDHIRCFTDLGCGDGECLMSAACLKDDNDSYTFQHIVGIELNHSKYLESVALTE